MSSTTWNGSSSTDWATGANWSTGSVPTTGAHVVIPDTSSINNCALDTTRTIGSLTIEANGTLIGGGNKLIIQSEGDASGGTEGFAVNNDGIISGNLDLEVNTQATTTCDFNGTSGNFKNVKINDVNVDATFHTDTTFDGTLIVAGGTLKPQGGSTIDVHGDVTISSGATFGVSTGTGTHRFGSLTVNGTHVATSGETIIDNERSNGRAVDIVGTFTHNNGTLSIQTAADTDLRWPSSSQAYNLRINNASCIARPTGDNKPLIANNLLISAGTFNTLEGGQNHGLTVAGDTTGAGTLVLNNSTYTGGGSGSGLSMTGTVTIGTSGVITNVDQLGESGGTITCTGSPTLGFQRWRQPTANWTPATSTLKIESNNRQFQTNGYGTPYNLEIDNSGETNELSDFVVVSNNLTITAGTLDTSSSNRALTVTGDASVTGTLTGNASAISLGSLKINSGGTYSATSGTTTVSKEADTGGTDFMFYNDGTFTHNNGKFVFDDAGLSSSSNVRNSSSFYDVELTMGSFSLTSHHNMNVARDFIVTTGLYNDGSNGFTITRDTIVENGATLNLSNSSTQTKTLGGLHLKSGSTFRACRGTTVISNRINGESHLWKNDGGTFNHNDGTVKFNDNDHSAVKENTFYNVEVESNLGDYAVSFEAQGGGGNSFTILNNLTITRGDFELVNANDTCDIHGQTIINGSSNSGARFNNDKNQTGTITHHGLVTIIQGTYHVEDGATVNMAGIRNVGGLVD